MGPDDELSHLRHAMMINKANPAFSGSSSSMQQQHAHPSASAAHGAPQVGPTLSFPSLSSLAQPDRTSGGATLTSDDIINVLRRGDLSSTSYMTAAGSSSSSSNNGNNGSTGSSPLPISFASTSSPDPSSSRPASIPLHQYSLQQHDQQQQMQQMQQFQLQHQQHHQHQHQLRQQQQQHLQQQQQQQHQYDLSAFDDAAFPLDSAYAFGTPSYAGSFVGSYESSAQFNHDHFSEPSSYNNEPGTSAMQGRGPPSAFDYYYQQELSNQDVFQPLPFLTPNDPTSAYSSSGFQYRDRSADHDDAASSYAPSEAGDSVAGSASGAPASGSQMDFDFDFDPVIADRTRSESPFQYGGSAGNSANANASACGSASSRSRPSSSMGPTRQETETELADLTRLREQATVLATSRRPSSAPRSGTGSFNRGKASPGVLFASGMLSESPPASGAMSDYRFSPPALTPLAIPSDGPSFNITQPTPHTARPKEKGQPTLELERMLGMNEWPAKADQNASFSDFTPRPIAPGTRQFPPTQPASADQGAAAAESLARSSSAAGSSTLPLSYSPQPPNNSSFRPSLAPYQPPPMRKRSQSDPAISPTSAYPPASKFPIRGSIPASTGAGPTAAPYAYFYPSLVPGGQGQFVVPGPTMSAAPLPMFWPQSTTIPPMAMNPFDAFQTSVAPPAMHDYLNTSVFDGFDDFTPDPARQHSLDKRSRHSVSGRRPFVGTPGYQEAGLLDQTARAEARATGANHRRSRSHTGYHDGSPGQEGDGLDGSAEASRGSFSAFDAATLARIAVARDGSGRGSRTSSVDSSRKRSGDYRPQRTASGSSSTSNSFLGPQHAPQFHQSPVASPSAWTEERRSSQSSVSDGGGQHSLEGRRRGTQPSLESKTTMATIQAAMRRRNPGVQAKFMCDLCGETFTRRYNLRGHQRAHRNEKPFVCHHPGCDKAFARSHDCKRHELLHLNLRRYSCEPCKREFVRLDALQRHHRSDVGQACVEQLKAQGFLFAFDEPALFDEPAEDVGLQT
ncbi:BZ3500_MvSof-1268-A1-R1_Chr9g10370 [Microbotryum saponariae]|uniref:BZ3500_MvSof-1268-A1-R1_Chr9g10370 protein n=1 Tax=Microbotryum saponariae TaxID=289078 RepID=A0A2X0KT17_9BASI|nr:BZ3501_MvSof-1269-A2-R1_Chr9g10120 [Microbotryum saponariae]SCZ99980.1 BZ3500_MvSof-1268-A1-R1_Chr9g10370 [Microbotryum saponariae]